MMTPQGRADTSAKKKAILERIEKAWNEMPEQRLGQLIENACVHNIYYLEDERLADIIESFVEHIGVLRNKW